VSEKETDVLESPDLEHVYFLLVHMYAFTLKLHYHSVVPVTGELTHVLFYMVLKISILFLFPAEYIGCILIAVVGCYMMLHHFLMLLNLKW
jgi:hypothetical protein